MSVSEIAQGLVALCKEGKFEEAIARYYDDEIESHHAMGEQLHTEGIDAVRARHIWWNENMTMHSVEVKGPYINGDAFAVQFTMDVTDNASGQRMVMDEIALYEVDDDKIVEESFFMPDMAA
jgi:hypothetical protein